MKKLMQILAICTRGGYTDSGWVDCATLVNGAQPFISSNTAPVKRRVLDFKKFKIVQIKGEITLAKDIASSIVNTMSVVTLPTGLPVTNNKDVSKVMPATYSSTVRWNLTANGANVQIAWMTLDAKITDGQVLWFPVDFTYISQ